MQLDAKLRKIHPKRLVSFAIVSFCSSNARTSPMVLLISRASALWFPHQEALIDRLCFRLDVNEDGFLTKQGA